MNRLKGLVLALAAGLVLLPATANAQKRPSDNRWTRSAKQYLQQAEKAATPEEKRGLYEKALQQLTEALPTQSENAQVWLLLGQTYLRMDDFVKADSAFTKAQELYPQYELLFIDREREGAWVGAYNESVGALRENRIEDAIALLEKADVIYRKRPEARLQLASLYAYQGDNEKAAQALEGALEILRGPSSQGLPEEQAAQWRDLENEAIMLLAQIREQLGKPEEALALYDELLGRNPENALQVRTRKAVLEIRQGKTEEGSKTLAELLNDPALDGQAAIDIGVHLHQGEQYALAADALRKGTQANPYSRDGFLVLADALYRQALKLEQQKKGGTGAGAKASPAETRQLNEQLKALYQEMAEAAEKTRSFEPFGEDALILLATAYRGLGDAESNAAASQEWKKKAAALLQELEALPFTVTNLRFGQSEVSENETEVTLSGAVKNRKLNEGDPVKLRITFLDQNGGVAGSQEVTVTAPAAESTVPFEAKVQVQSGTVVRGWKYERVS
jgi:tetratricopeptide (TPR) repeat protein